VDEAPLVHLAEARQNLSHKMADVPLWNRFIFDQVVKQGSIFIALEDNKEGLRGLIDSQDLEEKWQSVKLALDDDLV
jgi:hypothetical protein